MIKERKMSATKDRRRKYAHWLVTIIYGDGESFGRVYNNHEKAVKFATRQRKSPIVKKTTIKLVS
jgi:hypothetical protein